MKAVNDAHLVRAGLRRAGKVHALTVVVSPVLMIAAGGFRAMPSDKTKPLADEIFANVVIPMHYAHDGCGSRRMERVEAFTDQYMPLDLVRFYDTDTITIDHNTPQQVAVLKYMR